MGIVKRTHKKFDYQPRYYKGEGNPFEIKHKFDHFRTTTGNKNLKENLQMLLKNYEVLKVEVPIKSF